MRCINFYFHSTQVSCQFRPPAAQWYHLICKLFCTKLKWRMQRHQSSLYKSFLILGDNKQFMRATLKRYAIKTITRRLPSFQKINIMNTYICKWHKIYNCLLKIVRYLKHSNRISYITNTLRKWVEYGRFNCCECLWNFGNKV